jgi:hypothetical protein
MSRCLPLFPQQRTSRPRYVSLVLRFVALDRRSWFSVLKELEFLRANDVCDRLFQNNSIFFVRLLLASPPGGTAGGIGGNRRSLSGPGAAGKLPQEHGAEFNAREVPELRSVRRKLKG